jgi:hypothetical protein
VADHVDDDPVRVADEEAPRAPRLFGEGVDYLVATLASLCVGGINVVDGHADCRVLRRGSIPRDEADLDRTVLRRAEAHDPAKVELFLQAEEVDVEVVTGAGVAYVEVRDDPMDHVVADPTLALDVFRPVTGISRRAMTSLLRHECVVGGVLALHRFVASVRGELDLPRFG